MFGSYFYFIKDILSSYNDYQLFSIRSLIKSNIKSLKKEYNDFKHSINLKFCSFKELKTFHDKSNLYFTKLNDLKNDFNFISKCIFYFAECFRSCFIIFNNSNFNFVDANYIFKFFEKYNLKCFVKNIF